MTTPTTGTATAARRLPASAALWLQELTLLAVVYAGYLAARAGIGVDVGVAEARGAQILDLEALAGLDVEQPLNRAVTALPALGLVAAYLYATLHYLATPAVLVWLAARRRDTYRTARNALLAATAIGLVGYWLLPTAPPRLLDGSWTDTMAAFSDVGWWGDAASAPRGMESLSNQYAALPSLHVGWAVWVALAVAAHTSRTWLRRAVWAYPTVMALVVMATANHYLLDVAAGVACAYAGWLLARRPIRIRTPWRTR
jgi:hypothetical protein